MLADYLAAGPLIAERLRAEVAELERIAVLQTSDDLDGHMKQTRAAAFVVYDGDRLLEAAGRGQAQPVRQRWLVVLAVRNARAAESGGGVRSLAGPLLSALLRALQGWQPSDDFRPLTRVAAPRPSYETAAAYYPLAFEVQISTMGD